MHIISAGTHGGQEDLYDTAIGKVAIQPDLLIEGLCARRSHHRKQQGRKEF
jgi:hypothetical protein